MKITIEIDCTPDEARTFFGLPDVQPMQEALMEKVQERMEAALDMSDPSEIMRSWMPLTQQGLDQMRSFFWNATRAAAEGAMRGARGESEGKGKGPKDET